MFDLFRSRAKAVRYLLGGLLLLVALSMVITLIPGFGGYSGGGSDTVVAEIGGEPLSIIEVNRGIQNAMRGRQVPPGMMPHMVPAIVDSMITERALALEAQRMGFRITDDDVANAIRTMVPNLFGPDGKFVGADVYAAMLAQQNTSIAEFEAELKRNLLTQRLRNMVLEGVVLADHEVEDAYRQRNEKAKIEYVRITTDSLRNQVQATPEEVQTYFNGRKGAYQVPEKRSLAILIADQAKLEAGLQAPEAELQRTYNENRDRYRTPERVKVRHILLKTAEKGKDQEAAIRAKAEDLLKQVKGGADFAALAKKNSEDTVSAEKGGELPDWVTRGQTVPEFEKVAFSLKPKEISDLVKTTYGYHIVQVLEKQEARQRPYDEVKGELASEWRRVRMNDEIQRVADRAQAELRRNPQAVEKVAAELNLQVARAQNVAPGDPLPEVGVNRDFDEVVLQTGKGEVSQPVALSGNRMAMAVVTDIAPAHPATLAEVESQVREAILRDKLDRLSTQRANDLAEKARATGDLAAAAKAMGLQVATPPEFTRTSAVEGLGSGSYVAEAFTKPAGSIIGPISLADGRVMARVLGRTPPDMSQFAAQRESLRQELRGQKAQTRLRLFEEGLRQALIEAGKVKIHKEVVDRLTASYRG